MCDMEEEESACVTNGNSKDNTNNGFTADDSLSEESMSQPPLAAATAGEVDDPHGQTNVSVAAAAPAENKPTLNLPECRSKRSYVCGFCNLKTLNPREYLYHMRDKHGEDFKVFECERCLYASKTHQKLVRHNHMVHKVDIKPPPPEATAKKTSKPPPKLNKNVGNNKKSNFSPMNRSPRESKSPRRFEEYEFIDADQIDFEDSPLPATAKATVEEKRVYQCDQCDFSTSSAKVLNRHETKNHLKRKFYRCSRCNYATHVKGRYTKHMKYHEMPIIQCSYCDFSTPYRWNLDRHNKNHTDEAGEFECHLCNFKAQIKQSLTVHVANHHLSKEQIRDRDSKRTIRVNETEGMTEEEIEMLRMERDEDPDAFELTNPPGQSFTVSNIDMGSQETPGPLVDDTETELEGEPKKKKPKIKITLKKMKPKDASQDRHNFQEDFIHPDDVVQRHGNIYIKTEKCSLCPFKAAFQTEIQRHMKKEHGLQVPKPSDGSKKAKTRPSISNSLNTTDSNSDSNRRDEAVEHSNDSNGSMMLLDGMRGEGDKLAKPQGDEELEEEEEYEEDYDDDDRNYSGRKSSDELDYSSREGTPKKKPSFFDKLQEKLSMSDVQNLVCQFCGHESKCLSESVRHQKLHLSAKNIYASASLSTRCQFCRHRCKTTDDLMNHLKSCSEARKNLISDAEADATNASQSDKDSVHSKDSDSSNKHPMENKVFVWNNFTPEEGADKKDLPSFDENSRDGTSRTPSESSFTFLDKENEDAEDLGKSQKKVYKCPSCNFVSITASRFHLHIMGHLKKKPYGCSDCDYKADWLWEINKHIKLNISKGVDHENAKPVVAEVVEGKNMGMYEQFLTIVNADDSLDSNSVSSKIAKRRHSDTSNDAQHSSKSKSILSSSLHNSPLPATKIPAPPKLTRAPNRKVNTTSTSSSRQSALGVAITGQPQNAAAVPDNNENGKMKFSVKPPPLVAMGQLSQGNAATAGSSSSVSPALESTNNDKDGEDLSTPGSNYQIITPQVIMKGAMSTSLETLQMLASGSTSLNPIKPQQKESDNKETEDDSAVSSQMRLLLWLNYLSRGAEQKEEKQENNTSEIMQAVLDHEGNQEWKCFTCEFRDNEQETVAQHVRLAHSKKGAVSLVHAVHRCSVCGFAAGTKRHVQLHLETSHGGKGDIISRSEGQNITPENGEDNSRSFDCKMCPFKCKKRSDLKNHLSHHTPRVDYIFKCMFCPYYVATKGDLFDHLTVHGMEIPSENKTQTSNPPQTQNQQEDENSSRQQFKCDMCPFEAKSRAKLMHHRQFHRPRGLPFSCNQCSYNVTRRHLLAQHLRIHGISPTDGMDENSEAPPAKKPRFGKDSSPLSRSKSPSPSLTITPITSEGEKPTSKVDPSLLPTLTKELTRNLHDIPLVWVSRENKFYKMFKCRHCPHVNLRKTNIQEHEKMHKVEGPPPGGHKCQWCTYSCINAGVMTSHVKVHAGTMGKCHAIVDQALPNEEQLIMLANSAKTALNKALKKTDEKLLYYCRQCPSRFFFEREVLIHSRFHNSSNFSNKCDKCNFCVRDAPQLLAHSKVHSPEYANRTKTLMTMHPSSTSYPPIPGITLSAEVLNDFQKESNAARDTNDNQKQATPNGILRPWLNSNKEENNSTCNQPPPTSRFKCDKCPSTFSKIITLQYHQSLHSANNPFKCSKCTYAAKSEVGLSQHEALHIQAELDKTNKDLTPRSTPSPSLNQTPFSAVKKMLEDPLDSLSNAVKKNLDSLQDSMDHPPIKMKFIGLKGDSSSSNSKKQFKYYIEEQVPLSGVELLKRKTQIEQEMPKDVTKVTKEHTKGVSKPMKLPPPHEYSVGNPKLHYPMHIDKNSGRAKEKKFKCSKCPSAFEKADQFNVHLNLHGSNFKYKCRICDYTVKFYANFMMHIKRHKYHEKVDAQKKGLPPPSEDQLKFEPYTGSRVPPDDFRDKETTPTENKENQYDFEIPPDLTTAEKQQLILQHKKADSFKPKDEDKKIYYCQYCPYANTRRDAVDSHSFRHQTTNSKMYKCNFCNYAASQPNFIREHTKVHFRPFKYVQPEGFMRHDKLEVWSHKSGDQVCDDDTPKKALIFGHEEGSYTPVVNHPTPVLPEETAISDDNAVKLELPDDINDPLSESGILVDFRSGEVVEAPAAFIIPLRPSRKSSSNGKDSLPTTKQTYSTRYSSKNGCRKKAKLENDNLDDGNTISKVEKESEKLSSEDSVSEVPAKTSTMGTEEEKPSDLEVADKDDAVTEGVENADETAKPNEMEMEVEEDDNAAIEEKKTENNEVPEDHQEEMEITNGFEENEEAHLSGECETEKPSEEIETEEQMMDEDHNSTADDFGTVCEMENDTVMPIDNMQNCLLKDSAESSLPLMVPNAQS